MNATLGLLGSFYPWKYEYVCLGRSSGKETAFSWDLKAQMASTSKDVMFSCSRVLFSASRSFKCYGCTYLLGFPSIAHRPTLRHRVSPRCLLIQFAVPCCKEVESNPENEACFFTGFISVTCSKYICSSSEKTELHISGRILSLRLWC